MGIYNNESGLFECQLQRRDESLTLHYLGLDATPRSTGLRPHLSESSGGTGVAYDAHAAPSTALGCGDANVSFASMPWPDLRFKHHSSIDQCKVWPDYPSLYNSFSDLYDGSMTTDTSPASSDVSETASGFGSLEDSQYGYFGHILSSPDFCTDLLGSYSAWPPGFAETPRTTDPDGDAESWYTSCRESRRGTRNSRTGYDKSGVDKKKNTFYPDPLAAVRPASGTPDTQRKFVCQQPTCTHPGFARHADLERHFLHVHRPAGWKQSFTCDYEDCNRRTSPHHRKDHFRDHLRDVHREDLIKHGSNAHKTSPTASPVPLAAAAAAPPMASRDQKQQMERLWLHSLPTDLTWWRCSKCLCRVSVAQKGYICCNTPIEPIRLEVRSAKAGLLEL